MTIYQDYKIKVYLNSRHYIYINGHQGQTHPHTWEFVLYMRFPRNSFIEFSTFEHIFNEFLDKYQNKVLNNIEPFTEIIPTLENITEEFTVAFCQICKDLNGSLLRIEASETPTRCYIIEPDNNDTMQIYLKDFKEQLKEELVSNKLDSIIVNSKYNK